MPHSGQCMGALLGVLLISGIGQAAAQEYCVTCSEPGAVYRCIIDGARPGGNQPLQLLCASTMAKQGRHGACKVTGGTVFDCVGEIKHLSWAALNTATPPGAGQDATPAPAGVQPGPQEPPKTMVDLAKQTNAQIKKANEDMKEKAKSMGQAFGDASKKSWDCMISFFTRCGQ